MSIEQKVREEVERILVEKGWDIVDILCTSHDVAFMNEEGFDAITQALLSRFDIVEKGRAEKMDRVVKAAKAYIETFKNSRHALTAPYFGGLAQALKDLEG